MQTSTSTSRALPSGKACVYLGVEVAGEAEMQTWRLRAPICSASHPIVAAFHSLPAIHRTSQVDGSANANAPTFIEAGDDAFVQEQILALQEDLPLSVDDLLPPIDLVAFPDITSSQTHDTVLRHYGPQLYKAALQQTATWGSPIGQSEMSGRVRWIRDIDGIRKQVGPGCAWTIPRIRSYLNITALLHPEIAINRSATNNEDMAGFDILEDNIYMFYIRCNSLEAYAPADIADAAQQLKTKYERKFRSMDDVAGEDVSPGSVPIPDMLIWLERRMMSHIEDSVSINITESHLIAREEEYQYRIDLLRKIGRAAKATDES